MRVILTNCSLIIGKTSSRYGTISTIIIGSENKTSPKRYLKRLTVAGGPYRLNNIRSQRLRYLKPGFPRIAAATNIKSSGNPNAKRPVNAAFNPTEKSEAIIKGIKTGKIIPSIKNNPPAIKRPVGGLFDLL